MSTTPTPTPQRNNLLWWLLGLLVAGIVILGVGGVLAARFFLRSVHVSQDRVEVQTPIGEIKVAKNVAADPGLPVYPGAAMVEPGATVELTAPNDEGIHVTAAHYRTSDTLEKVDAWYREHLGPEFEREGAGKAERKKNIFGIQVKSDDVAFISEKNDLVRVVAIEKRMAGVEIALARIGKRETQ